jgi:hypothetical protein
MAYAIVYGIHTLEMSALRGWGVAYLAFFDVGNVAFPQLDRRCGFALSFGGRLSGPGYAAIFGT